MQSGSGLRRADRRVALCIVGSQIHHSVGSWPALIDDTTTSLTYVPGDVLVLRARAWPAGEADVVIEVKPAPGGCQVSMYEDAVKGPGKFVPPPLRHTTLAWRNNESLQRLAFIAEGKAARKAADEQAGDSEAVEG